MAAEPERGEEMAMDGDPKPTMTWEAWKAELERLAQEVCPDAYTRGGPIVECGEECWRESYDNGDEPADALADEMSYWED
jgi:hypothetical protein